MDQKELDKKWSEMLRETFDRFIRENVGYKEGTPYPVCFGSGDNQPRCTACNLRSNC
jgi:hypothetical protein